MIRMRVASLFKLFTIIAYCGTTAAQLTTPEPDGDYATTRAPSDGPNSTLLGDLELKNSSLPQYPSNRTLLDGEEEEGEEEEVKEKEKDAKDAKEATDEYENGDGDDDDCATCKSLSTSTSEDDDGAGSGSEDGDSDDDDDGSTTTTPEPLRVTPDDCPQDCNGQIDCPSGKDEINQHCFDKAENETKHIPSSADYVPTYMPGNVHKIFVDFADVNYIDVQDTNHNDTSISTARAPDQLSKRSLFIVLFKLALNITSRDVGVTLWREEYRKVLKLDQIPKAIMDGPYFPMLQTTSDALTFSLLGAHDPGSTAITPHPPHTSNSTSNATRVRRQTAGTRATLIPFDSSALVYIEDNKDAIRDFIVAFYQNYTDTKDFDAERVTGQLVGNILFRALPESPNYPDTVTASVSNVSRDGNNNVNSNSNGNSNGNNSSNSSGNEIFVNKTNPGGDVPTNVASTKVASIGLFAPAIVGFVLGGMALLVLLVYLMIKHKKKENKIGILDSLLESAEIQTAMAIHNEFENNEGRGVSEHHVAAVPVSVRLDRELKDMETQIKDAYLVGIKAKVDASRKEEFAQWFAEDGAANNAEARDLKQLEDEENELLEAEACLFAAQFLTDFEPSVEGSMSLSGAFHRTLSVAGGNKLITALKKRIGGDPNALDAFNSALGQTLAGITKESAKYQLAYTHAKAGRSAALDASLKNRLARRLKAAKVQKSVVLAETAIAAPGALPPARAETTLANETGEKERADLEAAFKKAYLEGLRHQLLIDRERLARTANTNDALRNRIAAKIRASEVLLDQQLATNKAALFAERFLESQGSAKKNIADPNDSTPVDGTNDNRDLDRVLRAAYIDSRRKQLADDRARLMRRKDLDAILMNRLAAQIDAEVTKFDNDDADFESKMRDLKMQHLRQQLASNRNRLAQRSHLDALLQNRLAANLKTVEKELDDNDLHRTAKTQSMHIDSLQARRANLQAELQGNNPPETFKVDSPLGMSFDGSPELGYSATKIKPGSNAEQQGLKSGMKLLAINGKDTAGLDTLGVTALIKASTGSCVIRAMEVAIGHDAVQVTPARKEELIAAVAQTQQELASEMNSYEAYLLNVRTQGLRSQLGLDRAMVHRTANLDAALKNRLLAKLANAAISVDMIDAHSDARVQQTEFTSLLAKHEQDRDRLIGSGGMEPNEKFALSQTIERDKNDIAQRKKSLGQSLRAAHAHHASQRLLNDQILVQGGLPQAIAAQLVKSIETESAAIKKLSSTENVDGEAVSLINSPASEYQSVAAAQIALQQSNLAEARSAPDFKLKSEQINNTIALLEVLAADWDFGENSAIFEASLRDREYDAELANSKVGSGYVTMLQAEIKRKKGNAADGKSEKVQLNKELKALESLLERREGSSGKSYTEHLFGINLEAQSTGSAGEQLFKEYHAELRAALGEHSSGLAEATIDDDAEAIELHTVHINDLDALLVADPPSLYNNGGNGGIPNDHSFALEVALKAAFKEGTRQQISIGQTEADVLDFQQKSVTAAKTELALTDPGVALRVAHDISVKQLSSGGQMAAGSALSSDDADQLRANLKASYLEGLRTPEEDQNELETRLRKARLVDIRRQLKLDRQQLEKAAKTDLTLKNRLLKSIQETEARETQESIMIEVQEAKLQLADDKAAVFAAQFIKVLDTPGGIVDGAKVPSSNRQSRPSKLSSSDFNIAETSLDDTEVTAAKDEALNTAMNAALRAAFQQGTRQNLAWKRQEANQRLSNNSKIQDRLAARLAATQKVAVVAAEQAKAAAPMLAEHSRRSSTSRHPLKTVSGVTKDFASNQRMMDVRMQADRKQQKEGVKSRLKKVKRHHRVESKPSKTEAEQRASLAGHLVDEVEINQIRQTAEINFDKEKAAIHREERMKAHRSKENA